MDWVEAIGECYDDRMHSRLPRFRRADDIPGLSLTDRDIEIVRRVARHRFLTSRQIVRALGSPVQPVLRRLQLLFHHGYLDRPRSQIDYFHNGGSRPIVYGLGSRAASFLRCDALAAVPFRSRGVGRLHLEHSILVAEILIRIELGCLKHRNARFRPESELQKADAGPFHWSVSVRWDGLARRVGVVPDAVFAIETHGGDTAYFFLEADRGTMPIFRRGTGQTSFFRKLLAYASTWSEGLHRREFGFHRFRVITVTTSAGRAGALAEAAARLPAGQGLFLFNHLDALPEEGLLEADWLTPSGHFVRTVFEEK